MSFEGNKLEVSPYYDLYFDAVRAAHEAGASDIHFEPTRDGVAIRFRIIGDMDLPWKVLGLDHRQGFFNEIKRLSGLIIAVSGRPQDGRVSFPNLKLDARVNLLPTLHGEKIVLRLLDLQRDFKIDALGIHMSTLEILKDIPRLKNGVVLISGPTGSGKTTTLYSLLCSIDRTAKNIITLEDPVEYGLSGLNQVPIDKKVSFGTALRSVLRQDPDVILVGEIRDEETASLCFKAAQTGHLVLSTIHANSAAGVIDRLVNLGVEKFTIAENLRLSVAQRLVKTLCPGCRETASKDILLDLSSDIFLCQEDAATVGMFKVNGGRSCEYCRNGFIGRVPILEIMKSEEVIHHLRGAERGHLKRSLKRSFLESATLGQVDIREVKDLA